MKIQSSVGKVARLTGILFLALSTSLATAKEISDAFGVTLGAPFDPINSEGTTVFPDGTIQQAFSPNPSFRAFNIYYVITMPETNIVYGIKAVGPFGSVEEARKEQGVIMDLLRQKYPDATSDGEGRLTQGTRYIALQVTENPDPQLEIRYGDSALEEQLQKSRLESEEAKTNASGL